MSRTLTDKGPSFKAATKQHFQMLVVVCVEKDGDEEAKSKSPALATFRLAEKEQPEGIGDWIFVDKDEEEKFEGIIL